MKPSRIGPLSMGKKKAAPERLLFANVLAAAALLLHPTKNSEPAMTTEVVSLLGSSCPCTGWSVQSCSLPDGVNQHSAFKASSFKCHLSTPPYQTVPAFRQACPVAVAPGKIQKPRLRFPCREATATENWCIPHLQSLLPQSFILASFMFRSCIRWSMLSLTLTIQGRKNINVKVQTAKYKSCSAYKSFETRLQDFLFQGFAFSGLNFCQLVLELLHL